MVNIEVARMVLALSDTIMEALNYIEVKVNELKFEAGYEMLNNVLTCMVEIGKVVNALSQELPSNNLGILIEGVVEALEQLTLAYQQGDMGQIMLLIPNLLLPAYETWQSELQRCLKPFILS